MLSGPSVAALARGRISAVRQFDQHVRVAPLGGAPAHEVLAAQLVQRRHERRLSHDPRAILRYHLVARAVAADHERIAPLAGAADVHAIGRRALAYVPGIHDNAHGHLPAILPRASATRSSSACSAMALASSASMMARSRRVMTQPRSSARSS